MIPVYGFLEGDTLGLLLLTSESETLAELIAKLQRSAAVRVEPCAPSQLQLSFRGRVMSPDLTVRFAGIGPLDRIDVRRVMH